MFSPVKKFFLITFSTLFLIAATTLIAIAMNWTAFRKVEQKRFHGQIINLTDKPVYFTHTEGTTLLPAGANSLDSGILDADGLIINRPTRIGNRTYSKGTFVLCDFGKITLRKASNGETVLEGSPGTYLCRMLFDYGFNPILKGLE